MNKIKVITNSYGVMLNPRWIKPLKKVINQMSQNDIQNNLWRLDSKLIKIIEKKLSEIEWLSINGQNNLRLMNKLQKLTDSSKHESWLYFKVKEVDIDRKWMFSEYDSSIDILYLEECNNEYNMYKEVYNIPE